MKEFDFGTEDLSGKIAEIKKKSGSLSFLRLLLFIGIGITGILSISQTLVWAIPFIFIIGFFVVSIQKYNFLKDQEAIYQALIDILAKEELRIARNLKSIENGIEFQDKSHPFANDLDLFGDHSLFQLVNHTVTKGARVKLSNLMKSPFDQEMAKKLQDASQELSLNPGFLRAIESSGKAFYSEDKKNLNWQNWLDKEREFSAIISVLSYLGPLGGLTLIILVAIGVLPSAILGLWILIGLIPLGFVFKNLNEAAQKLPSRMQLKAFSTWLFELEKINFNSTILKEKHQHILTKEVRASQLFNQLDRLGLWVGNRINFLYIPFNLLLWTDLTLARILQSWVKRHGKEISKIPELLEDWEVLISLGAFEDELGTNSKLHWSEEAILSMESVSHPLLQSEKAISNDFTLGVPKRFVLLTGANMSGKTTFMRTLGINCVMVNMGLKPYADNFTMGNFQLYTSMRNTDNLGESVSSFYAELSRIHTLIERLENGEKIFFLLDEILKGTNTEDRIAGSEALIRQVSKTPGFGIVSTHDIELSALEGKIEVVENRSFHSEILDDTINFDYKLKQGPCPSFNAHKLMELMGIKFQDQ